MKYSKEVEELSELISPYLIIEGIDCRVSPDAPDGTEELYRKFVELSRKEALNAFLAECGFPPDDM